MKKEILLLILCFTGFQTMSQITFDKGYYVDNNGTQIPVEIKYADWKNNPTEITLRTSPNAAPQTLGIEKVAAFGVEGEARYVRSKVPVDISDPRLKYLSRHGSFESQDKTVFLEVLVEGEADLFFYRQSGREQFFIRMEGTEIEPLIYKRYVPERSTAILENRQYRQQLFNTLTCKDISMRNIEKTAYKKSDLLNLFVLYNRCTEGEFTNYESRDASKDAFNLSIRPGINFSSLTLYTYVVHREIRFGTKPNLRLGLELEYILPFLRNKWAFIVEPTYQSFKGEADFPEGQLGVGSVSVDYQSIEIPFGVRHYFFLNENNRIFLNATYTADFIVGDSRFEFDTAADVYTSTLLETNTGTNFSFGGGYNYRDFVLEARYNLQRSLTGKNLGVGSAYNSFSLILGYNFL